MLVQWSAVGAPVHQPRECGTECELLRIRVVSELLEAVVGIGVYVVLFGLLLWALYFAFGPQVLGLPAMVGVLVIVAGIRISSNAGLSGLAFVVLGLFVLAMIIGMAMRLGTDRHGRSRDSEPPPD